MNRKTYIGPAAIFGLVALLLVFLVDLDGSGSTKERVVPDDPATSPFDAIADSPWATRGDDDRVAIADCLDQAGQAASNSRLMPDRRQSTVRLFFGALEKQGFDLLKRQLVADGAGLDPFSVETGSKSPAEASYSAYLTPPPDTLPLGLAERRRLNGTLRDPSDDAWVHEILKDPTVLRQRWVPTVLDGVSFDVRHTSVLGHLLHTRRVEVQEHMEAFPHRSFGLHELAVGIETGLPAARFLEALERSGIDPGESWRHHRLRREVNLAVVAAFNGRPDILHAFMQWGVEPSSAVNSVLDELAVARGIDRVAMEHVVLELASTGDRPFFPSSIKTFKRWFPEIPEFALHPDSSMALAAPGMDDGVKRLTSIMAEWNKKVAEARQVEERCKDSWLAATVVPVESLVAKVKHQQDMDGRLERHMEQGHLNARSVTDGADPEFLNAIDLLRPALSSEDWSEVLRLADEASMTTFPNGVDRDGFHLTLLYAALRGGAPMDAVRALVDRSDGALPSNTIMWLVGSSDPDQSLATAEALERLHGLNVHFVDEHGRNAVNRTVQRFRKTAIMDEGTRRWLDFLMNRSVTVKPSPFGLDPLDTVLLAILENPSATPEGVGLARVLINNGAPIETSHRELVQQIRATDADRFEVLVAEIPALIPG